MTSAPAPELSPLRRNLAVVSILLSTLMATIDTSIVNVALPKLSRELHAAPSETVWVATAFLLAVACAVPATSALGDQVGRRRLYLIGVPVMAWRAGVPVSTALAWNLAFIPLDLVKAVLAAVVGAAVHRAFPDLLRRR